MEGWGSYGIGIEGTLCDVPSVVQNGLQYVRIRHRVEGRGFRFALRAPIMIYVLP